MECSGESHEVYSTPVLLEVEFESDLELKETLQNT